MKWLIAFLVSGVAFASIPYFDTEPTKKRIIQRLNDDDRINLATEAYDAMFERAEAELVAIHHDREAAQLKSDWSSTYRGMLRGLVSDIGDHKPFSDWIAKVYQQLEDLMGVNYMELTHLRDIWVMNFAIMVVFHPKAAEEWCQNQTKAHPDDTCEIEYRRHFAGTKYIPNDPYATDIEHHGFAGVVAYWVTFAACEAATYGGALTIVCAPAATVVEYLIEKYAAPQISNKIYEKYNQ